MAIFTVCPKDFHLVSIPPCFMTPHAQDVFNYTCPSVRWSRLVLPSGTTHPITDLCKPLWRLKRYLNFRVIIPFMSHASQMFTSSSTPALFTFLVHGFLKSFLRHLSSKVLIFLFIDSWSMTHDSHPSTVITESWPMPRQEGWRLRVEFWELRVEGWLESWGLVWGLRVEGWFEG